MRRVALVLAAALALLAVGYLGLGLLVAARLSAPDRSPPPGEAPTPASVGLPYREVGFEAEDGVPLSAWWVRPEGGEARGAAVLVHGWGGSRSDDHVLATAPVYAAAGYGVLMVDLRGHGSSGGERRTLGYREVRDVRAALDWLGDEGYDPDEIVLHGWSMGGATVTRAAPGTGVSAVVEEAGYADLPLLLRDGLPESSGLPRAFNPATFLAAKLFLDFDPWAVRPRREAARLQEKGVPLYVVHSTSDETVPYEHAELFLEAYPEAELWTLDGYAHVAAHEHPEYGERLRDFLDSLPEPDPGPPG